MKVEKRKAHAMIAYLNDFQGGDLNKWRNSFYELWRYQLTFNFAYDIQLCESNKNGVYVVVYCKNGYKNAAIETMENLGYKVRVEDVVAGVVDMCDNLDIDIVAED